MREFDLTVSIRLGLFVRACGEIVSVVERYQNTEIYVTVLDCPGDPRIANAHSILSLVMLTATMGTRLHFEVSGPSEEVEKEAEQKLQELFKETFPRLYN